MELEKVVQEEFNKIVENGTVQELVAQNLKKTIAGLVSDALWVNSDFGKQLKEVVKQALQVDFSKISVIQYQQMITEALEVVLKDNMQAHIVAPLQENIKSIIAPFEKRTWKLSEIVEQFKQLECEDESEGELSFHVNHSTYGSIHIGIDKKDTKHGKFDCDWQFSIDKKDKKIYSYEVKESSSIHSTNPRKKRMFGGFSDFVFNLYASQSPIEVDEHACETSWYND